MSKSSKTHTLYGLISIAVDNENPSEDENLFRNICLEIKRSSEGPKIAAKAINKAIINALNSKKHQSIWYCILLLDIAVKSTDSKFVSAILTKEFLNDFFKITDSKYGIPEFVTEKFHYVIDDWINILKDVDGHTNLVKINAQANIRQQKRESSSNQQLYPVANYAGPVHRLPPNMHHRGPAVQSPMEPMHIKSKLMFDIDIIETNISIFSETLRETDAERISDDEYKFLKDLYDMSLKMQARITEALGNSLLTWEDVTTQLIQVNDKINSTVERYRRMIKTPDVSSSSLPPSSTAAAAAVPNTSSTSHNQSYPNLPEEEYDISSITLDTRRPELSEIYAEGSGPPAYSRTADKSVPDLINFDDEPQASGEPNVPKPPARRTQMPLDLLTLDNPSINSNEQNRMSEQEFDQFMSSITSPSNQSSSIQPPTNEEYAPPLYDEARNK